MKWNILIDVISPAFIPTFPSLSDMSYLQIQLGQTFFLNLEG